MNFNNNSRTTGTLFSGLALTLASANTAMAEEQWQLCHPWPTATLIYPSDQPTGDNAPLIMNADSAELKDQQSVTLQGNVVIQRPDEQLTADEATYNQESGQLHAQGHIRYDTDQFTALSNAADINVDTNAGTFKDNEYFIFERHTRGRSDLLQMEGEDLTVLKKASITTCDPGDEDWNINGSTVRLDHASGMGSVYNAYVKFKGVPFFYFPYISFPITGERTSGLLVPSFGSSSVGGNELSLPYYWNIHPQLDMVITPHNFTERGLKWNTETRYLTRFGEGTITSENLDDEIYGEKRELYGFKHSGAFAQGWSSDISYSQASDEDFFADFGNSLSTTATTHLERHAKVNYNFTNGNFMIQAQDYQTLDEEIPEKSRPYRRLPQLTFDYEQPADGLFSYGLESEWVRFQRQDKLTGSRLDLQPYVSLPYEQQAGFVIPKLSTRHTRYELDEKSAELDEYSLSRSAPTFSLDSGIFLERDMELFSNKMLHTFEPRLFYVYTPYRDQSELPRFDTGISGFSMAQLLAENRFNGADRVGDTKQISVALTTRLLESESGKEHLSATIGQIVYLDDRMVGLSDNELDESGHSDVVAEARLALGDYVTIKSDFLWNNEYELITKRNIKLQYQNGPNKIINMSYRYQGNHITSPNGEKREVDFSALWPINYSWSIIGRRYHSLEDDRTLEQMLGFEYNSCCWNFRLVRHALFNENGFDPDYDEGDLQYSWMAQLELKGLTSIGKRIEEIMEESIIGYSAVP